MPLDAYPFSDRYGWIQDKYGLSWQVMYVEAIQFYTSVFRNSAIGWDLLSAHPEAEQCGWLKDKYGVSWQIVPITHSCLPSFSIRAMMWTYRSIDLYPSTSRRCNANEQSNKFCITPCSMLYSTYTFQEETHVRNTGNCL